MRRRDWISSGPAFLLYAMQAIPPTTSFLQLHSSFVSTISRGRSHNSKDMGNVARSDTLGRANPSHIIDATTQTQHLRTTLLLDVGCLLLIEAGRQYADRIHASLSSRRNLVVASKVCPTFSNGINSRDTELVLDLLSSNI